jgi:hypothetical protein
MVVPASNPGPPRRGLCVVGWNLMRVMLIVLLAMSAAGCELIGGIFKAGVWVGAIAVILVVVLLVIVVAKVKG